MINLRKILSYIAGVPVILRVTKQMGEPIKTRAYLRDDGLVGCSVPGTKIRVLLNSDQTVTGAKFITGWHYK